MLAELVLEGRPFGSISAEDKNFDVMSRRATGGSGSQASKRAQRPSCSAAAPAASGSGEAVAGGGVERRAVASTTAARQRWVFVRTMSSSESAGWFPS